MKFSLITTSDGSHSLYSEELKEGYHSSHGALSESLHIFIEAGFNQFLGKTEQLNILEVGFGTGLNAFLTRYFCEQNQIHVSYHAVEAFPVKENIYRELNYAKTFNKTDNSSFLDIHTALWEQSNRISEYFTLHKYHSAIENFDFNVHSFDLVFFDAFAPQFQPEMWSVDLFGKIYSSMKNNSYLVTYCCKGDVKRALSEVGFLIKKLPGPKGKREILRAFKP